MIRYDLKEEDFTCMNEAVANLLSDPTAIAKVRGCVCVRVPKF